MKELTEQIADLTGCQRTLLERLLARQGDDGEAPLLPVLRSRRNYPLTASQRRLWLDDHLEAGNPAWNIVAPLRVEGPLDVGLLERCFAEIIRRHEALRVTFQTEGAEPRQVVGAPFEIAAERWPAEGATTAERLANSLQQARRASLRPFDLGTGPLLRLSVAQLADNDHLLVICVHHIVADGWSTNILLGEAAELYRAAIENRRPHLPVLTLQLIDYASWEKGRTDCDAFRSDIEFWKRKLVGAPLCELPSDRTRLRRQSFEGTLFARLLPNTFARELENIGVQARASLYMVLHAAFLNLLHQRTRQNDIVVGTGIANRTRTEIECLIGCFVNLLALRVDLSGDPTFKELLVRVREVCIEAFAHSEVPFDKIAKFLQTSHESRTTPLRAVLVLQNAPTFDVHVEGLTNTRLLFDPGNTRFDLTVFATYVEGGLQIAVQSATDLFSPECANGLLDDYVSLLERLPAQLDCRLHHLRLDQRASVISRSLRSARARPVRVSAAASVTSLPLVPDRSDVTPMVLWPAASTFDALDWARHADDFVRTNLFRNGAILFRDFLTPDVERFEKFVRTFDPELVADNGELPRSRLGATLYTAVDYPASEHILWHNENSFYRHWPARLWFFCVKAAERRGETPLADGRLMLARLPGSIRERFESEGIMYLRSYKDGLGLDWQTVFGTTDRAVVQTKCRALGLDCEWTGEALRTRGVRPGVISHPATREPVWFNQITHWHPSCLPSALRETLRTHYVEDEFPRNVMYGDGTLIEDAVIEEICSAYRDVEVSFPWREGDLLLVDNMLMSHGRNPYVGTRQLAIALAGSVDQEDLAAIR
jgi:hypothetical protein